MAIEITPLGFKAPDGNEPARNGDNVIADNARKAQELIAANRAELAALQQGLNALQQGNIDGGGPASVFDDGL